MWLFVVQTLPHQHRRLEGHPLTDCNQWSVARTGVMWSWWWVPETRRAALFYTDWRRRRWTSEEV